jgi:hypothetical protein
MIGKRDSMPGKDVPEVRVRERDDLEPRAGLLAASLQSRPDPFRVMK